MANCKQPGRLWRRRGIRLVLVAAALAGGLTAWRGWSASRRPNVLLITLDTTRADRLGCYGYSPALTPTLDGLAAQGVLFERAYTPIPLTLPAHASLMTGLYPREHGLITNGRGRLDDQLPTLAEKLRDAGYDTGAFVASFVLHSKFGLAQGFTTYDDDLTDTDPTEHGLHRQRDGRQVVDAALNWLADQRAKPFFCWVHLYDPHFPYEAHAEEFGDRFRDQPYDGELAYVDRQVKRLIDRLQTSAEWERTLVIVVGDHGESLGEHDEHEHGLTLYNGVLQIPFIWAGAGIAVPGKRVPQPISLIDFQPTLLEAIGLRDPNRVSGRSLFAVLSGGDIEAQLCYSATDEPLLAQGWSPQRSLTTKHWKYIRSPEPELYDLTNDSQEKHNLAADRTADVQEWDQKLVALEQAMSVRSAAAVKLSAKERQALASLGYLGGSTPSPRVAADTELPDVKRMLPIYNRMAAACQLMQNGDAAAAEVRLRELVLEARDYVQIHLHLAESLTAQHKFSESQGVLDGILQLDPDNAEAYFQLGAVAWSQRDYAAAAAEYRKALVLDPHAERVLFSLAQTLVPLGESAEAERLLRQAIDEDAAYVAARVALGNLLAGKRRVIEAEGEYRDALKYSPRSVEAHGNLAILLVGENRLAEAGEHFARAVELSPNNADLQFNYGTLLFLEGRSDAAIRALEQALQIDPNHVQAKQRLQQARLMRGL